MEAEVFADPELARLVATELIPVRVDTDRNPHVRDRYIAGGWPTIAFLTPTGEVLWASTYLPVAELQEAARSVLSAWSSGREALTAEIQKRRQALDAARARRTSTAIVRRESADDVVAWLQENFDPRNGGFGTAPKFPACDAVELALLQGLVARDPNALAMAERTLDGMLAGELYDRIDGGFFRYALDDDWTRPQYEKLLLDNAGMLRCLALAGHLLRRPDYTEAAAAAVRWARAQLGRDDGLWGSSVAADDAYYTSDRQGPPPPRDLTAFTDSNAAWARALADAGGRLASEDWVDEARATLTALWRAVATDGPIHHASDGQGVRGLLNDIVELGRACVSVAQATGDAEWMERARQLAGRLEQDLLADDGGFLDWLPDADAVGALGHRDRPFESNAAAALLMLDLWYYTGGRGCRAMAERTLAQLGAQAPRFGSAAATYALAVHAFFEPPLQVVIVGAPDASAALRQAALALPLPQRRVWTLPQGGRFGGRELPAQPGPAAYLWSRSGRSAPLTNAEELRSAAQR